MTLITTQQTHHKGAFCHKIHKKSLCYSVLTCTFDPIHRYLHTICIMPLPFNVCSTIKISFRKYFRIMYEVCCVLVSADSKQDKQAVSHKVYTSAVSESS